jgi:hypothetical protein
MRRWFQKILLFIAVATIVGHSSLPHQHHAQIEKVAHHDHHQEEQGTGTHHHDHDEDKDEDHSLFSFAQLDENFVPGKFQDIRIELPIVYLLTPIITIHYSLFREKSKTHFGFYKEYPPPGNYLSQLPSRGPPSLSNMA